ncbi:MAG: hypothetical protein J6Y30_01475 [Treponema sp.]|nr:hypothetical protein [Treponema sp.]
MKKIVIFILLLFICNYIFSVDYKIIKKTELYDLNYYPIGTINKNEIVKISSSGIRSNERYKDRVKCKYLIKITYNENDYLVDIDSLIAVENNELFKNELTSHYLNESNKFWINKEILESIIKQDRNFIYKKYQKEIDKYELNRGSLDSVWYESGYFYTCPEITYENFNLHFYNGNIYFGAHVLKISNIQNGYIVKLQMAVKGCELEPTEQYSKLPAEDEIFELKILFDGDYMYVYNMEGELLFINLIVDNTVAEEYKNMIQYNNCDLSKIVWPCHADGSCDYN